MRLSLSTTGLAVEAGQQAIVQVGLTRTNLTEPVQLTVSDLPAGVTGQFSTATLASGSSASTLTLSLVRGVRPGAYRTIVTASATSVNAQAVALDLIVLAVPSIAVLAKPDTVTVVQGASGMVSLDVSRTNFPGSVNFRVLGDPPGVVTRFPDAPTTASVASARIEVAQNVDPGTYPIRIESFGSGVTAVTTLVTLTVRSTVASALGLAVAPEQLTIMAGEQESAQVVLKRTAYTGPVTLQVAGLPPEAVSTLSPPTTTGDTVTLTVSLAANTSAGPYPATITATAEGLDPSSVAFDVLVLPRPSIALTATPDTIVAPRGTTGTVTVGIRRTSVAGPATLSLSTLPPGVTALFSSNPTIGASEGLQLAVAPAAIPGRYFITVTAQAPGAARASTQVILSIP